MLKDLYKSIIKNGKYYFFTSIIDRIVSIIFFFILAKSISVEEYGDIVTIFAVSNIVLTIFDFGLQIYLQKETATKENISDVFSSISFIKLSILFVYYLIVIYYLRTFNPTIPLLYIIIIAAISFIVNYITLLSYLYYGKNKISIVFYSTVVSKTVFLFFVLFLFLVNNNLILFLLTLLLAGLLQLFILLSKLKNVKVELKFNFRYLNLGYNIIKISFPLGMAVFFNLLYDKLDIVLISRIVGNESVGQYNIAYSSYKLVSIVFGIILVYGFNVFSKTSNRIDSFRYLFHFSIPIVVISIASISFFYFFGETVLNLLFGQKYLLAGNMLPIISFAILGFGLNSLTGVFINAKGRFKAIMLCTALGLLVNVVINIVYLPTIGVMAAIYSTIVTEYIILFFESIYIYFFIYKS